MVNSTTDFWPDCKPEGPLFSAEFVCLVSVCVCVCVSLTHRHTHSLAATIMVHIDRRATAQLLFENFKKFSKITQIEFQNSGPSFFASVSPACCKKFDSIRTKLIEEIHFEVCPYRRNATMDATPPSNAMRPPQAPTH